MKKILVALMMGVGVMSAATAQVEAGDRVSNFYSWDGVKFVEITDFHMACKLLENPSSSGNYIGQHTLHYATSGSYFYLACKTDITDKTGIEITAKLGCMPPGYSFKDLPDGCYTKK